MSNPTVGRDFEREMLQSLPDFYRNGQTVPNIIHSEAEELKTVYLAMWDVFKQAFLNTATWSLDTWESMYDIPNGSSLTDADRRNRILAKMRGVGTVTKDMLKNIVESYGTGSVSISENTSDYEIVIEFVGAKGIPSNIQDIERSVNVYIPAHLAVSFVFSYTDWGEIMSKNKTWADLKTFTWGDLQTAIF